MHFSLQPVWVSGKTLNSLKTDALEIWSVSSIAKYNVRKHQEMEYNNELGADPHISINTDCKGAV